jgi:hypothetical protein
LAAYSASPQPVAVLDESSTTTRMFPLFAR